MELSVITTIINYTIPSVVTGLVAYFFFLRHTKTEEKKMHLNLLKENNKYTLPIKLQAYERMTLYLERINLSNLIVRVTSINNDKDAYAISLVNTIEQEFEHNLAQQIYISEKCWSIIITSKNATKQRIQAVSKEEDILNAQELREAILKSTLQTPSPSITALAFIKDEVRSII